MRTKQRKRCKKKQKTVVSVKKGLETKTMDSPEGNHILDNTVCYGCGKSAHLKKQCPKKRKSALMQACEVQPATATTNLEGGNMPKQGASTTLLASPTTPGSRNLDNLKCFECGKNGHFRRQCPNNLECFEYGRNGHSRNQCSENLECFECGMIGHFQNQCPNNKLSVPTQAYVVLPTNATTNMEGGGNTPKFEASTIFPTPSSNHNRDNVKCFECGKSGHYQNQCSERKSGNKKCFECGNSGHYQNRCPGRKNDNVKCFECGTSGHYRNQCPERKISSPVQAYEALLTIATTNMDGGNMSKHGAPATSLALPMTPDNHNLDNSKYCEYWKNEHFQNQFSDNKVSAPMQVDAGPPTIATTNLEGFESVQLPSAGAFGSPSNHSTPFESSKVIGSSSTFGAPSNSLLCAGVASSSVCGQSSTPALDASAAGSPGFEQSVTRAFDAGAASSPVFGQSSSPAFDVGTASSPIFGRSSTPVFDAGAASSPVFVQSSAPAFCTSSSTPALLGFTSTSACDFQNTSSLCESSSTPALGSGYYTPASKNSTRLAPAFGTTGTSASVQQSTTTAVGLHSNQSSPLVSHHAISSSTLFGVPSQYAFGQSSTTVMGKAGSMPTLFGSTATSTSAFGSQSNMSYLSGTSSNSFGGVSSAPSFTFGSQTAMPGNQTTMPENQMTTPENQTTIPECQTSAPECQTTTPGSQTGVSDQQNSIETPYCSTQENFGKSVSILDKVRQEGYHGNKGCDREQVQASGQTQSSPFVLTNIASSFDQLPKTDAPQLQVVVTSETNKGSGDAPYMATKTSVWWDIENCPVPRGNSDTYYIAQNISSALADAGYKGAVTISAYGDTHKIPKAVQQALSSTGIALNHVPAGVKDASDKKILVDMLFWAVDNPPPANYLLISGDRDFSNALHQLRLRRYNILLAHAPSVSQALVAAAKKVWQWASLLSGGPPSLDLESDTRTSSVNRSNFNVIKGPIPKRLSWKDQNARVTQKTFSVPQSKEGCDIHSENLACLSRVSKPKTSEITRLKRAPISSPSHEIICAKRPRNSVDSPEQMPLERMLHLDNEKNLLNSQPFKVCQPFVPSIGVPSQNTNSYSSITQPNHQRIIFGPPHLQSMQNKSIIQHPEIPSQIYNDNQNSGYQVHSSEAHRHIGHIVNALTELKANKIAPTEENISNCIHYDMGKRSFNVKIALDYACENNMLARYNLDNGALFYLGKNEQFWECVNVLDINDKHSEETWNAIRNFLSSASGRSAILSTECRYHAATVLKKACLQCLALGEVLQLLNTVIKFRKWIVPNPSGWQPLSFTLKVLP